MRIKNSIPTSFVIDLTTVDLKVDKLVRFLQNSSIDLKGEGYDFKYSEPTYDSIVKILQNRKYKEKLSEFVSDVYTKRFVKTREKLITQGVATDSDFLLPQAMDDFGSNFDAFAATNTDPNNSILSILNVKPYRFLKVDIFTEQEVKAYFENISSATYDVNKLTYILSVLDSITTSYVDSINFNFSFRDYSREVENKVLSIKTKTNTGAEQSEQQDFSFLLTNMVPDAEKAIQLIQKYNQSTLLDSNKLAPTGVADLLVGYPQREVISVVGQDLFDDQISSYNEEKKYDSRVIETAKIKLVDYLLKKEIRQVLEEKISAISFLNDFKSSYTDYNFFESKMLQSGGGSAKIVKKEELFFRLMYLRETDSLIVENRQELFSNLNVEFINRQFITLQSPFGPLQRNDKFVAIIGGSDISNANNYVDFFQPTILKILSDIDYISENLVEIDPYYCPVPQSGQPSMEYQKTLIPNEYNLNNMQKDRHYVEPNIRAFDYFTFPDNYFIPNFLLGPSDFYETVEEKLTRNKVEQKILQYSKYYYSSDADTPAASIIREENINRLLQDSLLYDGFGPYAIKKNSFADPLSIQPIIAQLSNLGNNAAAELQSVVFARTNISCLLKEFQTCFMPQVGNCRDILRGFRFTEIEQVIQKAFPQSVYATLYVSIEQFLITNAKSERERTLLREIKDIEKQLNNSDRKKLAFVELDKRKDPADALNVADQQFSSTNPRGLSLDELYKQKLQEYKELKLNQEDKSLTEQDKIAARRAMQPEELQKVDDFLDLLEDFGINTDILCSLVDLFNISPTFGTITLPELPQFDIYSEIKLSVNLAIVKLILDTILAFIIKILEELLTCGGIKNLLAAAITGEAGDSITGAGAAAINQIARGTFDLDEFVEKNPQVNPDIYAKNMAAIASKIPEAVSVEENTAIFSTLDLGFGGEIRVDAKTRAQGVLFNHRASATTETEVKVSLIGLIDSLVRVLTSQRFIEVVSGNGNKSDFSIISKHIEQNQPELLYLSSPDTLRSMFSYIGRISGLDLVRNELMAVSSFYTAKNVQKKDTFCVEQDDDDNILNPIPTDISEFVTPSPDDKYRELLQDLLSANPNTLKNKIDEEIFKPLLMGMLPDGKKLSSVDAAKKKIISSAFDIPSKNFKEKTNDLYSKLVYKKQVKRIIRKFKEGSEIEDAEYKDYINKGGYKQDHSEPIEISEKKYVYGGLFSENFQRSSKNLDIDATEQQIKITLNGNVGYKDQQEEQINSSMGKIWKIENYVDASRNTYKIFENERPKFIYDVENNNTSFIRETNDSRQKLNLLLKQTIDGATQNNADNVIFKQYTGNAYSDFISLMYGKITKEISSDGLLKQINPTALDTNSFVVGINSNLSDMFPGFENISQALASLPPMVSPFIDTPMKYVNFSPKPTKEQKTKNVDPSLYGKLEVEQLVYNILDKREKDLVNFKTLQQMLQDDDNTVNFSVIDGLYFSLVRGVCIELCMRAIFPLRVFKFDKSLIEDMMLPTYGASILYAEIEQYASVLNKSSIIELSQAHIEYLHNFIFSATMSLPENSKLFLEVNNTKETIVKLKEDKEIIKSYLGRFYINTVMSEEDKRYKDKLISYLACLVEEIEINLKKLCNLQIRNLIYNELIVVFEKLSFLTSTNLKVRGDLTGECKESREQSEEINLQTLISDILLRSSLHEVTAIYPEQNALSIKNFIKLQKDKLSNDSNLFLEHYIDVPLVKQQFQPLKVTQERLQCLGITRISQFRKLISSLPDAVNLQQYFSGPLTYGLRMIYVPSTKENQETSQKYEDSLEETYEKLKNSGKNKFVVSGSSEKDVLSFITQGSTAINEYMKTFSIPYYFRSDSDDSKKLYLINAFPIVEEKLSLSSLNVDTKSEVVDFLDTIVANPTNRYTNELKLKLNCSEKLAEFYKVLTNENLLSNMMIFSSINILSNEEIKLNFSSLREKIYSDIVTKLTYTYNKDDFKELMDKMGSRQYFKQFNADLAVKLSIRAAIYVLQYYCQMTDPNISIALLIRNAIKIALSVASQLPIQVGGSNIPAELPLPLTPLAIYSMAQLPITVFGVPPAGIGVGPPLTIPGMVLLGAEAILLALEFAEDIDFNSNNEKINQQLKDMCFDLSGYKKYGIA
jgi:hypothetical protein